MSSPATGATLYPDAALPYGTHWKNALAVSEYKTISKVLEVARTTKNLDTVAGHLKIRQHKLATKKNVFDPSVLLAFGLGVAMALGFACVFLTSTLVDFGLFLMLLSFFHMWEYTYVSMFHPETLSYESFLLTHSRQFHIAMGLAFSEYFIEWYFFPSLKGNWFIYIPSFIVCVIGQAIRTTAMYSAGDKKADNHTLVTTGIYSIWRHPSYFGWFWWSVFTQVLLASPFAIVAFTAASWMFFADRIPDEEEKLENMFGAAYREYCKKVPIRIPFIPSKY